MRNWCSSFSPDNLCEWFSCKCTGRVQQNSCFRNDHLHQCAVRCFYMGSAKSVFDLNLPTLLPVTLTFKKGGVFSTEAAITTKCDKWQVDLLASWMCYKHKCIFAARSVTSSGSSVAVLECGNLLLLPTFSFSNSNAVPYHGRLLLCRISDFFSCLTAEIRCLSKITGEWFAPDKNDQRTSVSVGWNTAGNVRRYFLLLVISLQITMQF